MALDDQPWVVVAQLLQQSRHYVVRGADVIGEADRADQPAPGRLCAPYQVIGLRQHPPGLGYEHPASLGKPGRAAMEELDAEHALKVADLPAQRRLRHVQPPRGRLKSAFVGNCDDIPHDAQVHRHTTRVCRRDRTGLCRRQPLGSKMTSVAKVQPGGLRRVKA